MQPNLDWESFNKVKKGDSLMRVCLVLLASALVWASNPAARADLPRSALKAPPQILARQVKELVLTGTIPVGKLLPPGLPTTITYKMTPNTFRPVAEDAEGVYYEAVQPLQKHMPMYRGGVYMSKTHPDKLVPYRGHASDLRLPVAMSEPLHPGHAQKFRVVFADYRKPARK